MDIDQIRELLGRYYEAQTTDAEERALREALLAARELPADLELERRLLRGVAELAQECAPAGVPDVVNPEFSVKSSVDLSAGNASDRMPRSLRIRVNRRRIWRGVACAAVLVVGVVLSAVYMSRPYGYINGKPVRDAEVAMRATAYLGVLKSFDRPIEMLETMSETNKK